MNRCNNRCTTPDELKEEMSTGTKVLLWLLVIFVIIPTVIALIIYLRHRARMKAWTSSGSQ